MRAELDKYIQAQKAASNATLAELPALKPEALISTQEKARPNDEKSKETPKPKSELPALAARLVAAKKTRRTGTSM